MEIIKINQFIKTESMVREFNRFARKASKAYGLFVLTDAVYADELIRQLLFCLSSHPDNGMIAPISNIVVSQKINSTPAADF